jgi:putative oxidoreductase
MDVGLLLIRAVLGVLFVGHGSQKLFGWFGGHGLAGTGGFFEGLGYRPGRVHAAMAGLCEVAGGVLLALGLLTPLGAAIVIGVMVNAMGAVHWRNGLWVTKGGIEYGLVSAAVAAGLAFTGAGGISLDRALDLDLGGNGWGLAAVLVGLVAGIVLLATRTTDAPAEEPGTVRGDGVTATTTAGREVHAAR